MKPKFYLTILKTFSLVLIVSFIFYSCKKDSTTPPYVGTWAATYPVTDSLGTYYEREIYVFAENSFTETIQETNQNTNQWFNYYGTKGDISVTGKIITLNITDIGVTTFTATNQPTGVISYYNEITSPVEFQTYLSGLYGSKTGSLTYSISGKYMNFVEIPNRPYVKQ